MKTTLIGIVIVLIGLVVVLFLFGGENTQSGYPGSAPAYNPMQSRAPGPSQIAINSTSTTDVVKDELKYLSQLDGPRGVSLFLVKFDKDETVLEAKCDESFDFADTIMAIVALDEYLHANHLPQPQNYRVKYSGVYVPHSDEFVITRSRMDRIKLDSAEKGLVSSVINTMASGAFGAQLESHGKYMLENGYKPSASKIEMYLHEYYEPTWKIYIY
jgi:hypothetical protein